MKKKSNLVMTIVFVMMCVFGYSISVGATDSIGVVLDGKNVVFEDQKPVIMEGRTLVPVRSIFEAMGLSVAWDSDTKKVTGVDDKVKIELYINSKVGTMNGKEVSLDVPAQIYNGRTVVPLRFIAESCDSYVEWDADNRDVIISKEHIKPFKNDDGLYGFEGEVTWREIIEPKYYEIMEVGNGSYIVGEMGEREFVNKWGKIVSPLGGYTEIDNFKNGHARVNMGSTWGMINEDGKEIVPVKYSGISEFEDGKVVAESEAEGKKYIFNQKGELVETRNLHE